MDENKKVRLVEEPYTTQMLSVNNERPVIQDGVGNDSTTSFQANIQLEDTMHIDPHTTSFQSSIQQEDTMDIDSDETLVNVSISTSKLLCSTV